MNQPTGPHYPEGIGAHHAWHSAAYVADWIAGHVTHDNERRPHLCWAAALLPLHDAPSPRVLDVGGGYGVFAGQLLGEFRRATVCVQDYSAEMLEHARSNLAEFGERVLFVQSDLTDPAWTSTVEGPFDAVVSALAIHNLGGADAIRPVYAAIHSLLRPGGWFLNQDLVFDAYFAPADSPLA
jgi:SAM-dependent methyltransferase